MSDNGYFYIVQLAPDIAPNRLKFGWSRKPDQRLRTHRTAAPTAGLLQRWACHKSWEVVAIADLATGAKVGPEVFDCDDVEHVIARASAFFAAQDCQAMYVPGVGRNGHITMNLRLPADLHAILKRAADEDFRSMNNLIVHWLWRAAGESTPTPKFPS